MRVFACDDDKVKPTEPATKECGGNHIPSETIAVNVTVKAMEKTKIAAQKLAPKHFKKIVFLAKQRLPLWKLERWNS